MCRRSSLHGWCCIMLGLGVMLGHSIESWFICSGGGLALVILGFVLARKR